MRTFRRIWTRIVGFVGGARRDDDLDAEMRSHLQLHIDDEVRRGASADEARRRAVLRLGGVEVAKEAYRDQRGLPVLEALRQDLRYARRMVARQPAFYALLVAILGGTLGLCAVIFSVAYAVVVKPLPYDAPERLVRVHELTPDGDPFSASAANAFSWQESRELFEDLVLFRSRPFEVTGGEAPERLQGAIVSADFFDLLRVRPMLGRAFLPGEDQDGRADVLIISHGLWTRRFGGQPDIVGRTVAVDGRAQVVVGVLPADFEFPAARGEFGGSPVDLIAPIGWTPQAKANRDNHIWRVIGRLRPGVSLVQASAGMDTIAAQLAQMYETNRRWGAHVEPLRTSMFGRTQGVLSLLLGGVGALLLIGCANVANLLLARGVARRREFVVRTALGGSAARLGRQVLTESLLLAGLGALLAIGLARGGLRLFLSLAPADLPRIEQIAVTPLTIAATCTIAVLTALLFGIAPAWRAGHVQPADVLRAGGRGAVGTSGFRLQSWLVAGQMAMTVVLLVCAGLLVRSALLLQQTPVGFVPDRLVTARIALDDERYPGEGGQWRFLEGLLERVRAMPGVTNAAATLFAPMVWGDSLCGFFVEGRRPQPGQGLTALRYSVTPTYFETIGQPLLAGRAFRSQDRPATVPVVIVNEFLARKHLVSLRQSGATHAPRAGAGAAGAGDGSRRAEVDTAIEASRRDDLAAVIGSRIVIQAEREWAVEIVGVVGDTRHYGVERPLQEQLYLPYAQSPSWTTTLLVKTTLPVDMVGPELRRAVAERDPRQPVSHIIAMTDAIGAKIARPRLTAGLLATFASLGLLLAGAGIFALLSYLVGQRTSEMGLRLALGAQRSQVLALVLTGGLRIAGLGLLAGLAIAWPAARGLQSLLFGIDAHDPLTFAIVAAVVVGAALLACLVPARRAAQVDPATALRSE